MLKYSNFYACPSNFSIVLLCGVFLWFVCSQFGAGEDKKYAIVEKDPKPMNHKCKQHYKFVNLQKYYVDK